MLPHFICIGVYKSGTTWLYQNLREKPEVWLPPFKELRYFSRISKMPYILSLLSNEKDGIRLRRKIRVALLNFKKNQHISWYFRYFFLPHNDAWYASLFLPKENQITGDIDGGYDIINQEKIAHIHFLMPDLKIIYLIRNPIHRMCSQAFMSFNNKNNLNIDITDKKAIKHFFDKEDFTERSQYIQVLNNWKKYYPSKQIFVAFFEQLQQDPIRLFKDICQFLEINSEFIPDSLKINVNQGNYSSIPEHWIHYLAQKYHASIKSIHEEFNNQWTAEWLEYSEKYL